MNSRNVSNSGRLEGRDHVDGREAVWGQVLQGVWAMLSGLELILCAVGSHCWIFISVMGIVRDGLGQALVLDGMWRMERQGGALDGDMRDGGQGCWSGSCYNPDTEREEQIEKWKGANRCPRFEAHLRLPQVCVCDGEGCTEGVSLDVRSYLFCWHLTCPLLSVPVLHMLAAGKKEKGQM